MISVIIPLYNKEHTIGPCLKAVFASRYADYEVIVVDDGSRDVSAAVAAGFPAKIIRLGKNMGLSHARNIGAIHAQSEILVFIDADVVIRTDTLGIIESFFKKQAGVAGVVGLLDENCPHDDFFSQYKNLYMNFTFNRVSSPIRFFYGSIHAVREKDFQPYDESLAYTEDTDLGQKLSARGKKIFLLKNLLVTHLKRYNFLTIIKNDFRIPFYWTRLFFKYSDPLKLFTRNGFAHAGGSQISSVLVATAVVPLMVLSVFSGSVPLLMPGSVVLLFICLNISFIHFLFQKKGAAFASKSLLFTLLDQNIMALGIALGAVRHFVKKVFIFQDSDYNDNMFKKINYWFEAKRVEDHFGSRSLVLVKDLIYPPIHHLCAIKGFRRLFFRLFGTTGRYEPKNRGIISVQNRFLFFYIPKTATTTIKKALAKILYEKEIEARIHSFWFDEVIDVQKGEYADYFKFTFVRNPWDRAVSCYSNTILHQNVTSHKYKNGVFRKYADRYENLFYMGMPFDEFVRVICAIPDEKADRHFRSQRCFVTDENDY